VIEKLKKKNKNYEEKISKLFNSKKNDIDLRFSKLFFNEEESLKKVLNESIVIFSQDLDQEL